MEKRVSILLACLAISALVISTTSKANLLVDPGMEGAVTSPTANGINGWTFSNPGTFLGFSTNFAHSGTNSMELAGAGGFGVPLAYQTFAASPGQQWTMSGFALTPKAITPAVTDFGGVQITFFAGTNGTGANLGTVETSPNNALFGNHIDSTSTVSNWIPVSVTAHAPLGAQSVQAFDIVIDQTPTTLYFDDMSLLEVVPEPSTVAMALTGLLGLVAFAKKRRV